MNIHSEHHGGLTVWQITNLESQDSLREALEPRLDALVNGQGIAVLDKSALERLPRSGEEEFPRPVIESYATLPWHTDSRDFSDPPSLQILYTKEEDCTSEPSTRYSKFQHIRNWYVCAVDELIAKLPCDSAPSIGRDSQTPFEHRLINLFMSVPFLDSFLLSPDEKRKKMLPHVKDLIEVLLSYKETVHETDNIEVSSLVGYPQVHGFISRFNILPDVRAFTQEMISQPDQYTHLWRANTGVLGAYTSIPHARLELSENFKDIYKKGWDISDFVNELS